MLTFKQYIQEGIVKLNEDIVKLILYYTFNDYYKKYYWHVKNNMPIYIATLDLLNKKHRIHNRLYELQKEKIESREENGTLIFKMKSYEYGIEPIEVKYDVFYDYPDINVKAGYDDKTNSIMINFHSPFLLLTIEAIKNNKERIFNKLEMNVESSIRHELVHSIREYIVRNKKLTPFKVAMSSIEGNEKYLSSDIERESWAINTIDAVKIMIEDIRNDIKIPKKDLKEIVKYWLGTNYNKKIIDLYSDYLNDYEDSTKLFLFSIKKSEPKLYRNVINKVYQELDKYIDSISNTNQKVTR